MAKLKKSKELSFLDVRRLTSGLLFWIIVKLFEIPLKDWGTGKYQTIIVPILDGPEPIMGLARLYWNTASIIPSWLAYPVVFGVPLFLSLQARAYAAGGLKNGVYKDRVLVRTIFARFNPWQWIAVVQKIHMFQHEFEKALKLVKKNAEKERNISHKDFQEGVGALLYKSKEILDVLLRADVHVHIKLFQNENIPDHQAQESTIKNSELRQYARCGSNEENDNTLTRNPSEIFLVTPQHYDDYKEYIEMLRKDYPALNSKTSIDYKVHRVNSAYNYVLHEQAHFFVCNDLKKAQDEKAFYSTSNQWENFYNSLAVFTIYPHIAPGGPAGNPKGLLIIDSLSTGKFDKNALRDVGGYLAHRFFDFFEIIKEQPPTKTRRSKEVKRLPAPKLAIDAGE